MWRDERMSDLFQSVKDQEEKYFNSDDKQTLGYLKTILTQLEFIDEQYPARALSYILSGQDVEFLIELMHRPNNKAGALIGGPAIYPWYHGYPSLNKQESKQLKNIAHARFHLYSKFFHVFQPEQVIRYSKFLAAASLEEGLKRFVDDHVPTWLLYLMVDGLYATLEKPDRAKHHRESWTLNYLLQLLKMDDIANPERILLEIMFERKNISDYYHGDLKLFYNLSDTVDFLNQHTTLVEEIIPQLSIAGQALFLNDFATHHPEYVKQHPKLMVHFATSDSKKIRELATAKITELDVLDAQQYLNEVLIHGRTKQRSIAADLLARGGEVNRQILVEALANETQKTVKQNIESALSRLDSLQLMTEETYTLAPITPIPFLEIPETALALFEQNYQELLEKKRLAAENEIEKNKTEKHYRSSWAQQSYKRFKNISETQRTTEALAFINNKKNQHSYSDQLEIISYRGKIKKFPEYGLHHALILSTRPQRDSFSWYNLREHILPEMLENIDLRQVVGILKDLNFKQPERLIASEYLYEHWGDSLENYIDTAEQVYPFFAEHLEFISEALGLLPDLSENRWLSFLPAKAIKILRLFPQVPKQYVPKLLEIALGENKRLRFDAQELLQRVPLIHQRAIEALTHGKQEIRITAVEWLARLQHKDAIQPLYALLKKEKKEIVIAAILTALEQLGEDISNYLTEEHLLKDAEKGLSAKCSASFTWFDLDSVPEVKWKNGQTVNQKIVQWWIVLAEKLKDPIPNALLQRYLGLLDEKSQQKLSLFVLQSFIHQDTRSPTLEEATAQAVKDAPARLRNYQDWYNRWGKNSSDSYYARWANITLEQVKEEIKNECLATYLGSAIKSKGMLALANKALGSVAVKLLQDYMKQHYRRTSQITALIQSFVESDDPLIIQLLLGISRRYRTNSIQTLATEMISEIAERNHWTADELADRTIPTAGFDESGILTLEFGSRVLTVYIDDKDKYVLKNEEGKLLKNLPTARQDDDPALIKEAKALFSNSKKEFKQVMELQSTRLYEAMCAERVWSVADWQEYLFAHPIMKRLIARLVWLEVDHEGKVIQQFRPSEDGALLNLEDDEITLNTKHSVKIAHRVLIDSEDADAWVEHFKDYKVKFLFEQMVHDLPKFTSNTDVIEDRKGWITDTYTLRGVVTKLGYQRASIEDGGSFDRYFKPYQSLGVSCVISFSGSWVPEENMTAVLYDLSFERENVYSWNSNTLMLETISPVLLAESYADYLKIAEACSGFDPDWQNKTPW